MVHSSLKERGFLKKKKYHKKFIEVSSLSFVNEYNLIVPLHNNTKKILKKANSTAAKTDR
jgi:hypothetical protein